MGACCGKEEPKPQGTVMTALGTKPQDAIVEAAAAASAAPAAAAAAAAAIAAAAAGAVTTGTAAATGAVETAVAPISAVATSATTPAVTEPVVPVAPTVVVDEDPNLHYVTDGDLVTIKGGDIFYDLAQKYGTTVESLQKLNPGVDYNNLQIGSTIRVRSEPLPPDGLVKVTQEVVDIKEGDIYYNLASKYGTTVEEMIALNPGVDYNNLQVGTFVRVK